MFLKARKIMAMDFWYLIRVYCQPTSSTDMNESFDNSTTVCCDWKGSNDKEAKWLAFNERKLMLWCSYWIWHL